MFTLRMNVITSLYIIGRLEDAEPIIGLLFRKT